MEEEKAKTCSSCGTPLKEGASFCTRCGAMVGAAAAAPPAGAAGPPPQPQAETMEAGAPPPPRAGYEGEAAGVPAPPAAPARGRGKALLAVGIFGGILALGAAVFLVLYLTIWRGGGGGTGDPVALAEKYISALEDGDFDAYMDCMDPESLSGEGLEELDEYGLDIDREEMMKWAEEAFKLVEYDFEGVKLEETSRREDKATVASTAGSMSFSAFGMDREVDLAEDPLEFKMVKKEGRWYITEDPLGDIMRGSMGLEDFDFEDMEEMLPDDMRDLMEDLEHMFDEEPAEEESTT